MKIGPFGPQTQGWSLAPYPTQAGAYAERVKRYGIARSGIAMYGIARRGGFQTRPHIASRPHIALRPSGIAHHTNQINHPKITVQTIYAYAERKKTNTRQPHS
jgi:hypothetical protein